MIRRFGPLRHLVRWRHQIALASLLALQGAITLSPLLEAGEKGRIGAHVEQQGATHRYQHDEATCAVCKVRSLHSSPAQNGPAIVAERLHTDAVLDAPPETGRCVDPTSFPRAPPLAG